MNPFTKLFETIDSTIKNIRIQSNDKFICPMWYDEHTTYIKKNPIYQIISDAGHSEKLLNLAMTNQEQFEVVIDGKKYIVSKKHLKHTKEK